MYSLCFKPYTNTIHNTLHCNPTLQRPAVLLRSAPRKNQERTQLKLGAHPVKTRSAPKKNQERTWLNFAFLKFFFPFLKFFFPFLKFFFAFPQFFLAFPQFFLAFPQFFFPFPQFFFPFLKFHLGALLSKTARRCNVGFVLPFVQGLCSRLCRVCALFCVGFACRFVQGFERFNVQLMYSLCIVWSTNYTSCNARIIRGIMSIMQGLCIVRRVFLFPLLFTYSTVSRRRHRPVTPVRLLFTPVRLLFTPVRRVVSLLFVEP